MDFELWLAFIATYAVISAIPGPSVLMVTAQALTRGTPAAFFCILGDVLGGVVLMILSLVGVGALLATSAALFQAVKWAGVLYMAYLGISQIREARKISAAPQNAPKPEANSATLPSQPVLLSSLRVGFLTGVLNPKAILFYMAFLSQFLDPKGDSLSQFLILMASSSVVVALVLSAYALLAAKARQSFQSAKAQKRFGYAGGSFFLGGSLLMATR